MWRVAIALVMVLSLGLVMAAPVAANVSQPTVSIAAGEATPGLADADYTIKFVSTVALTDGVDTITITFPSDTAVGTVVGTVAEHSEKSIGSGYTVSGRRLSITVPSGTDIRAGREVTVFLSAGIKNPTTADTTYTLTVYTSKEPTAVTSAPYIIGKVVTSVSVSQDTSAVVNTTTAYTIAFETHENLVANTDTITITFPDDTYVPTPTIAKANVKVWDGSSWTVCTVDATAVGRTVTVTVPANVTAGAGKKVEFAVGAGIKNPTTVKTSYWTVTMYTSKELARATSAPYSTIAATYTAITKLVIKDVDCYIPNDTKSTVMKVEAQDQYGNPTAVSGPILVLLSADPSGGIFYNEAGDVIASVSIANGESLSAGFKFKSAPATSTLYRITAAESPAATPDWTNGTCDVLVNPKLELWGGGAKTGEYSTFADAIAAALPYDTIKVAASTYNESFDITKEYLTIESKFGAATTIIDCVGDGAQQIHITKNNVTLGGSGKGFTIRAKNAACNVELTTDATKGITIKGNIFRSPTSGEGNGIRVNNAAKDVIIDGNSFYGDAPWTSSGEGGPANAIQVTTTSASGTDVSLKVTNNTAYYLKYSFLTLKHDINGVVVSGNTVHDVRYHGVHLCMDEGACAVTGLKIYQNTFYNNGCGVQIDDGVTGITESSLKIWYNDIYSNTNTAGGRANKGVNNAIVSSPPSVNAKYNYWGSPTGPSDATNNPSGAGDAVSTNVTYSPWLSTGQATVVSTGKSQYAISVKLTNVASLVGTTYSGGWNTFSTPIWLDGSANTWGAITALVNLQYVTAYGWDGTNWVSVGNSTAITPLDAIFVQLKTSAQSVPILYSTQLLVAPTKTMHATAGTYTGWELIGLASMQSMVVKDALNSLGAAGTSVMKYSQVIDPISGAALDVMSGDMYPGHGYWVFMMADATLAGFTVTPVPFVAVP